MHKFWIHFYLILVKVELTHASLFALATNVVLERQWINILLRKCCGKNKHTHSCVALLAAATKCEHPVIALSLYSKLA